MTQEGTLTKDYYELLRQKMDKWPTRTPKSKDIIKILKELFTEEKLMDMDLTGINRIISGLEEEMYLAAKELDFERAAVIRDEIGRIKKLVNI